MGDVNQLIFAILRFFEEQQSLPGLSPDAVESLEVSSQCLSSAYDIDIHDEAAQAKYALPGTLMQIFQAGVAELNARKKAPTSEKDRVAADQHKSEGNELMKQEKFAEALECYNRAIELDENNAVYHCNRAAAHSKMDNHRDALVDCLKALQIDPNYSKAYGRKGLAHIALEEWNEAGESLKKAIELDPENQSYKQNLEIVEQKIKEAEPPAGGMNFGGLDLSQLLSNPALMNMATSMMANPQMQQMMGSLMGGFGGGGMPGMGGAQPGGEAPGGIPPGLLQVGQQMAQQMQQSNPELVEQLREQMRQNPDDPPEGQ